MSETSAENDGSTSQLPQPDLLGAEAGSQCPICLRAIKKAAFVAYCMHCFCFACIRRWTSHSATCPICRQEVEILLHSVQGEEEYMEYLVGVTCALRRRNRPRSHSRSPHHGYNLRSRPTNRQPAAGTSGPARPNHGYNLRSRPTNRQPAAGTSGPARTSRL